MSEDTTETIEETTDTAGQDTLPDPVETSTDGTETQTTPEGEDKAPDTAAEPEAPAWTTAQLSAMKRHGVDPESLTPLGDKGRAVADKLVEVYADQSRRYAQIGRAMSAPATTETAAPKTAATDGLPQEIKFGDDSYLSDSDQQIVLGLNQQLREFKEQFGPVLAEQRQRAVAQQEASWDRFFGSYGADGDAIFGKGKGNDLTPDSAELTARNDLLAEAAAIQAGHQKVHGKSLSDEEALQRAARVLYPSLESGAETKRKTPTTTPRPSQTRRPPTNATAAAISAMDEADKRHGGGFFLD